MGIVALIGMSVIGIFLVVLGTKILIDLERLSKHREKDGK